MITKLFRERNVEYINKYADKVLCVSERVKEIAIKMGISPEILITDYIGTEIAKKQVDHGNAPLDSEIFTIVFMGYMRRDKGFFFLLKALNQINEDIAKNIKNNVTLVFHYACADLQGRPIPSYNDNDLYAYMQQLLDLILGRLVLTNAESLNIVIKIPTYDEIGNVVDFEKNMQILY